MTTHLSDTFSASDGTNLDGHTPDVGSAWSVQDRLVPGVPTLQIIGNALVSVSPGYGTWERVRGGPSGLGADFVLALTHAAHTGYSSEADLCFGFRRQSDGERLEFRLLIQPSVSSDDVVASLRHVSAGESVTVLDTDTETFFADYQARDFVLTVSGGNLTVTKGGVGILSASGVSLTASGFFEIYCGVNPQTAGARVDNLLITSGGGGGSVAAGSLTNGSPLVNLAASRLTGGV